MFPRFDLLYPGKTNQWLLICYPPGSRGDFLASILKNNIQNCYDQYVIAQSLDHYKKIHWVKDVIGIPLEKYETSIRIRLSSLDDYLTVAHFWKTKLHLDLPTEDVLHQLIENERIGRNIDHTFSHVIDFKSLFDIDAIKNLYQDIKKETVSDGIVEKIQHNISLQQYVTTSVTLAK